jgi:hypothetical protein
MTREFTSPYMRTVRQSAEQFEALKAAERSKRDVIMRPDGFLLDGDNVATGL